MKRNVIVLILFLSIIGFFVVKLRVSDVMQTKTVENPIMNTNTTVTESHTNADVFTTNKPAPELTGITAWLNPQQPISIASLRGKVILVDFWTNQCINCIHTLPYVTKWYDTYKDQGFIVIGVHTPELSYEFSIESIKKAITQYGIHYPVAQDNDYKTWNAYENQYWPAVYLIDKKGIIRREFFGEGEYDKTELAIQTLLKE